MLSFYNTVKSNRKMCRDEITVPGWHGTTHQSPQCVRSSSVRSGSAPLKFPISLMSFECVCVQDMGANQPPPQLHAHEGRHGRPKYTRTRQNTQTHTLKSNFKFNSIATPSRERTGYAQHPGCEKGSSLSLYCTTAYASPIVEEKSAFTSPPAF